MMADNVERDGEAPIVRIPAGEAQAEDVRAIGGEVAVRFERWRRELEAGQPPIRRAADAGRRA
jgi:hypothetical protein